MHFAQPKQIVAMVEIRSLRDKWLPVSIAPYSADLELCVMDFSGIHALVFPCRKNGTQWVDASTQKRIDIEPTHWRIWKRTKGR